MAKTFGINIVIVIVRIRYDTRCYFNVQSKADISQLNLPHGTDNEKVENRKKLKSKKGICSEVSVNK